MSSVSRPRNNCRTKGPRGAGNRRGLAAARAITMNKIADALVECAGASNPTIETSHPHKNSTMIHFRGTDRDLCSTRNDSSHFVALSAFLDVGHAGDHHH